MLRWLTIALALLFTFACAVGSAWHSANGLKQGALVCAFLACLGVGVLQTLMEKRNP
jgi:hypothetical protein